MALSISIGTAQHMDYLKAKLGKKCYLLERKGFKVNLHEQYAGKYTFLSCQVHGSKRNSRLDTNPALIYFIAELLSEFIINKWERRLLWEIICNNYYYFENDERRKIMKYIIHRVNFEGESSGNNVHKIKRKNHILSKLMEFLHDNNEIVIEGFIKFRLKEYIKELRNWVEEAIDEYLLEQEQNEFVELLRCLVEIQETRTEVMHVVVEPEGNYKLLDGKSVSLDGGYLSIPSGDFWSNEINYDDILVSTLIIIAPKEIVFHYSPETIAPSIFNTIKSIFNGNVKKCKGCPLCRPSE